MVDILFAKPAYVGSNPIRASEGAENKPLRDGGDGFGDRFDLTPRHEGEAHESQMRVYRLMTDEQRSVFARRMSEDLRQIASADPATAPLPLGRRREDGAGAVALRSDAGRASGPSSWFVVCCLTRKRALRFRTWRALERRPC